MMRGLARWVTLNLALISVGAQDEDLQIVDINWDQPQGNIDSLCNVELKKQICI